MIQLKLEFEFLFLFQKTPTMVLRCRLFQSGSDGIWNEYCRSIMVDADSSGVLLRDATNNTLLADFPKETIKQAQIISENTARVVTTSGLLKFALQFTCKADLDHLIGMMRSFNVSIEKLENQRSSADHLIFPDLQNEDTQELVLNLMFSDNFKTFARDLEKVLGMMSSNLNGGNEFV